MLIKIRHIHNKHLRLEIIPALPRCKHEIPVQDLPVDKKQIRKTLLTNVPSIKNNKRRDLPKYKLLNKITEIKIIKYKYLINSIDRKSVV